MASVSKLDFFLCVLKPVTVLSGQVNGAPTDPYMDIIYEAGATGAMTAVGASGAPLPGNTVWFGTSAGGQERGAARLRSWSPSDPTGTTGALSIAETDDVGPAIADGDYISVKLEWRLWPIAPRLVQRGTEIEFYEDYDIGFTDQTVNWRPVAVAGPPAVEFLSGGQAQVSFVGDRSFALAPGASISSHLWTAHNSLEGSSSNQGTEADPVIFTWTAAGQYLISLQATDSNGNSHTAYTWAFIIDPADPAFNAYTQFDAANEIFDFFQGGGECSFTIHGVADVSEFPREAMVIHACRGNLITPTGSWPFRTNILFVGYIVGNSIRQDSIHNTTSFRAVTIDGLMKNLSMHAVSLRDRSGPHNWTMAKDITLDRAASFLMHWRSTLAMMTPIIPLNYTAKIRRQDFSPTNLYQQLQSELIKDAWGRVVSSPQSVLHLARDCNLMIDAERATITRRKMLHKGLWLDPLDIEERSDYMWPARKVKMSGIFYPGNNAEPIPYFSEAPGDIHKSFGREDAPGRLILTTQADLNIRCGHALARQNYRWPRIRARFINDGAFTIAPQEIFSANIQPEDNNRGLSWAPDLIPRRLRRIYDHQAGYFMIEVEFEPSITGPAGVTVAMPSSPPRTPTAPQWQPAPTPEWTEPIISEAGAAVAADAAQGVFWTTDKGATWERRVAGLAVGPTGVSQTAFNDLIWDPWWRTPGKTGSSDPEQVILWGCGRGFLARAENAARNGWQDLTPYLPAPDNSWGDDPAPASSDLNYIQIMGDNHNIDTFYLLAEWQNPSGEWRGWLLKTGDNGKSWSQLAIAAPQTDGAYYYARFDSMLNNVSAQARVDASDTGYLSGAPDDQAAKFTKTHLSGNGYIVSSIVADFGAILNGADMRLQVRGVHDAAGGGCPYNLWKSNQGVYRSQDKSSWISIGGGWIPSSGSPPNYNWGGQSNAFSTAFRYARFRAEYAWYAGGCDQRSGYIDAVRVSNVASVSGEVRPLAMDLDTENGARLFVTVWDGIGGLLQLHVYNENLIFQRKYDFGSATKDEVAARDFYIRPRSPHYPGVVGFGDRIYIFGRYDDGGEAHLALSIDAGESFNDIGWAGWTGSNSRVGALGLQAGGAVLHAFITAASPSLWESENSGSSWAQINSLPFSTEAETVSRHVGASMEFLIGNRVAGVSSMAAFLEASYVDAWRDATGPAGARLPVAADGGGGLTSIIWIS